MKDLKNVAIFFLMLIIVTLCIGGAFMKRGLEKSLVDAQNKLIDTQKSVEVAQGLYARSMKVVDTYKQVADLKDAQIKLLLDQLKKIQEEALAATSLAAKWKHDYESVANSHESTVPGDRPDVVRKRVDFEKDFGFIGVNGYTLTEPAFAFINVHQNRPLKINVVLTMKDGTYRVYATSSEENVELEISSAGIDPSKFKEHWYEKIGIPFSAGLGGGLVASAGVTYRFGKFDVGPAVFVSTDSSLHRYFGFQLSWHPFSRE